MKGTTCYKTRGIWCSCGFSESKEGGEPLKGLKSKERAAPKSVLGVQGLSLVSPVEAYLQQESISVICAWSLDHCLLKLLIAWLRVTQWMMNCSFLVSLIHWLVQFGRLQKHVDCFDHGHQHFHLISRGFLPSVLEEWLWHLGGQERRTALKNDHRRQTVWLLQCHSYYHSQLDCGLELVLGTSCPTVFTLGKTSFVLDLRGREKGIWH